MRTLAMTLLALCVLVVSACSDPSKRQPVDSIIGQEITDILYTLQENYSAKHFSAMSQKCSPEVFDQITKGLKNFESVELEFTPSWIEISADASRVDALVKWDGTWVVDGKEVKKQGSGLFVFEGKPYKVVSLERANPFSQP